MSGITQTNGEGNKPVLSSPHRCFQFVIAHTLTVKQYKNLTRFTHMNEQNDEANGLPYSEYSNRQKNCKNCNMPGHIHRNCGFPITSIGVILCCDVDTSFMKLLMVRRKDTYGYVDFLRGKLNFNNHAAVQSIVDEMTVYEKETICSITCSGDICDLRKRMWGDYKIQFRKEESDACVNIMNFITNNPGALRTMVDKSTTKWIEPEWGFPKGKREQHENDIRCGLREFEEETGISRDTINVLQNIKPVEEVYIGTDKRPYKHKYFISVIDKDLVRQLSLENYQKSEISKISWMTIDESFELIRPNNQKKKDVVTQVRKIFKKYKVI